MIENISHHDLPEMIDKIMERRLKKQEEQLALQLTLPMWTDEQRGIPNGPLRSCLFAAIARRASEHLEQVPICAQDGIEIMYTGRKLDQDYLTLWEALLHMGRKVELGTEIRLTVYEMLQMLGKTDTGPNRKILLRQLDNLKATAVEIKQGRYSYIGSLLDVAYRDEVSSLLVIALNKNMVALFQPDGFTKLTWTIRQCLKRPLAKWLYGYYSSHAQPFDVSVAFLRQLSGSETKNLIDFKNQRLIPAFEELAAACEEVGEYFQWEILSNNLVRVRRSAHEQLRLQ